MLSKVDVTSPQGAQLELPLGDPLEGYLVKDIEGTDPVKATLVSSSVANMDGEQYHSSRREARDLTFKIGLEPGGANGSGRALRANLYNFFMPKAKVNMQFHESELGILEIEGIVESFDCPMFVQELEATILVRCYESNFVELEPDTFEGVTTSATNEMQINYNGTVETGFAFSITADQDMPSGFTIFHRAPDNSFSSLEFTEPLSAGDVLDISTISGAKGATLTSEITGTDSILYGVTPYSNWINLFPGINDIRVYVEEVEEGVNVEIPFTITYTVQHGGL